MSADDPKILKNLKEKVLGTMNSFTGEPLQVNSTYNDLVFGYWHVVDGFPEHGFRSPNNLTSIEPITRAIRLLPGRVKNIKAEQRIREYYTPKVQAIALG